MSPVYPLQQRRENNRDPKLRRWLSFAEIREQFDENMQSIRQKSTLADDLMKKEQNDDAQDILRTQVVFAFSALDYFMHELAVYGVVCIFDETWLGEKSEAYSDTVITMRELEAACNAVHEGNSDITWLREKMEQKYQSLTFMRPGEIQKILKLLGLDTNTLLPPQLTTSVENAYKRRCKIVHRSDRDANTKTRVPLNHREVDNILSSITEIVENITCKVLEKEQT